MNATKIFIVKKGDEIPPKSVLNFNLKNQISDWYFAQCIFQSGNIKPSIVCYDYKNQKWLSTCAGFKGVEEYYVVDENFNNWINNQVLKVDLENMLVMFNSMDEEDKIRL